MVRIQPIPRNIQAHHTIRPSDNDMEAVSPLAFVVRLLHGHWRAPEGALVVGQTGRIGAVIGVGVDARISFDVHVERLAVVGLVAQRCTLKRVEGSQGVETHVLGCAERPVLILKDQRVAVWRGSVLSNCLKAEVNMRQIYMYWTV